MSDHNTAPPFVLGMFEAGNSAFPGVVAGDRVWSLAVLLGADQRLQDALAGTTSLYAMLPRWDEFLDAIERALEREPKRGDGRALEDLRVVAPMPQTRQIICTGANYRRHVIDLVAAQGAGAASEGMTREQRVAEATRRVDERARSGLPYAFPKLVSSICGPFDDVVIPRDAEQFDWELELGVVIGRGGWRVPRERAMDLVAGYTIVNDLTRRELVYRSDMKALGSDWLRCKSGPGFMPTGPWLVPARYIDPRHLTIRLELNGDVMQDESTSDMLFDIPAQIEYVSRYARLLPGDLIATGSPAGNGMHHGRFLKPGDVMTASIHHLGTQINRCVAEELQ